MRNQFIPAAIRAGKQPYYRLTLSTGVPCVTVPPSCTEWASALAVPMSRPLWGAFIRLPAGHPWRRLEAPESLLPPTAFLTGAPWGCAEHGWNDLLTKRPWLRVAASTRKRVERWAEAVAQAMRHAEPEQLTRWDMAVLLMSADAKVREYALLLTENLEGNPERRPAPELPAPVRGWRWRVPGLGGEGELLQDAAGAWFLRNRCVLVRRLPSVPGSGFGSSSATSPGRLCPRSATDAGSSTPSSSGTTPGRRTRRCR